ncbi:MAG: hypothetical protein IJQ73_11115 [Kiritimatiellae bacterium]|nr:hypothetical protein [Kiritimatiellia bacterium]
MKKFCRSTFLAVLAALVFAPALWGQLPPAVAAYGRDFAKEVLACQAAYTAATNRIPAKYARDLAALQAKFQEAGDLDALLAVKKEIERFKKVKSEETDPFEAVPEMPSDAIVAEPAELRQLQEHYVAGFTEAAAELKKGLAECGERLRGQIKAAQTALTKAGKIEEAIAMRDAGDKVAAFLDSGDISQILGPLEAVSQAGADRAPAASAPAPSAPRKPAGKGEPAGKWRFLATRAFSRDLPRYFAPDVPNELIADYNASKSIYTLSGKCTVAAAQVGDVLCSWNGRAFIWSVPSADALATDIRIAAKSLSTGADNGPHLEVAVLGNGVKLKSISVPITRGDEVVRIMRNPASANSFALFWPRAGMSKTFEVQPGMRLNVLIGAVLHNPGETCDLSFQLDGSN